MALRMDSQSKTAVIADQTFPRPPTQKNHADLVEISNKIKNPAEII